MGYEVSAEVSLMENILIAPAFGIAMTGDSLEKFNSIGINSSLLNLANPYTSFTVKIDF